jgi:pimeloyl-ACP methyl ester carboxylesterase
LIEGATQRTVRSGEVDLAVTEAGDSQAPAIVFVHGYPDTRAMWAPVLARLAGGFHVVAYDVRGAGESSHPRGPAAYDLERLIEDFAAVLDAVSPDLPGHLVGHDWGGIQGWEIAASPLLRGRLRSFTSIAGPSLEQVAAGTQARIRRGQLLSALARLRRSWYVAGLCTPGLPTLTWRVLLPQSRWRRALARSDRIELDERYPAATLAADGTSGANLYRRNIAGKLLQRRGPVRSPVPVQLIIPRRDPYIPESYYELAEQRAPAVLRRTVPGAHWAPRAEPERVAGWIAEFVRQAEKESAG